MKFEIFERLNTGSISLNAQELRNSIYRGNANKLLRSLAKKCRFTSTYWESIATPENGQ
jgi:hypothetical protein